MNKQVLMALLMSVLMLTGCATQESIPVDVEPVGLTKPTAEQVKVNEEQIPEFTSEPVQPVEVKEPTPAEKVTAQETADTIITSTAKADPVSVSTPPDEPEPVTVQPTQTVTESEDSVMEIPQETIAVAPVTPVSTAAPAPQVAAEELIIVEHAKTGYDELEEETPPPVVEPEPEPTPPADIATAIMVAEGYAMETYNLTIDPTLDFDNSSYRFPAVVPQSVPQETLNTKAIDMVEFTFQQMMRRNGVSIEKIRESGIRCRIYIESNGTDLYTYVFYA